MDLVTIKHNAKIMKKVFLLMGLASVMSAFTGCSKEDVTEPEVGGGKQYTINSVIAGNETRTDFDTQTLKLSWRAGDKIKVYTGSNANFTDFETANGDGVFSGAVQPSLTNKGSFVAVYPNGKIQSVYDPDAKRAVDALRVAIAKQQAYEANKGPVDLIPMIGLWGEDDQEVMFKPVGSILKLPVYVKTEGTKIQSVAYQFKGSGVGAGEIALKDWALDDFEDYKASDVFYTRQDFLYGEVTSRTVTVSGDIAPGTTISDAATIYTVVAPGDYKDGYSVIITGEDGATMTKTKAASETTIGLQPGKVQSVAALQYTQKAPEFTVVTDPTDPSIVTATLTSTLPSDCTCTYRVVKTLGMPINALPATAITEGLVLKMSDYLTKEKAYTAWIDDGNTVYFVIEAVDADGTIYSRNYPFVYKEPKAPAPAGPDFTITAVTENDADGETWLVITVTDDPEGKFSYVNYDYKTAVIKNSANWMNNAFYAGSGSNADESWDPETKVWKIKANILSIAGGDKVQIGSDCDYNSGVPAYLSNIVTIGGETPVADFTISAKVVGSDLVITISDRGEGFPEYVDTDLYVNVDGLEWDTWDAPYPAPIAEIGGTWNDATSTITIPGKDLMAYFGAGIATGTHTLQLGHTMESYIPTKVSNEVEFSVVQ